MIRHPDCKICGMLDATAPEDVVLAGDHWGVVAMQDVPGMVMVFTRDHDLGVGTMSGTSAAELGPMIRTLSSEIVASGAFERTSVIYLGDNAIHTHFMILGRRAGEPPLYDNTPLLARFADKDRDRARSIAANLRRALTLQG